MTEGHPNDPVCQRRRFASATHRESSLLTGGHGVTSANYRIVGQSPGLRRHCGEDLGDGGGPPDVALGAIDAAGHEQIAGLLIDDELGDRPLAHTAGSGHDGTDDDLVDRASRQAADEVAVDLEEGERQPLR